MKSIALSVWLFINLICFGMCGYLYLIWSKYWLHLESDRLIVQTPSKPAFSKTPDIVYYGLNLTDFKNKSTLKKSNAKFVSNDVKNNNIHDESSKEKYFHNRTDKSQVKGSLKIKFVKSYQDKSDNAKYSFPTMKPAKIKNIVTRESGMMKTQFLENKNEAQPRFNLETPFVEFDSKKYQCDGQFASVECMARIKRYRELLFQEFDRCMRNDEKKAKLNNRYNVTYEFKPVPKGEGFGKFNSKDLKTSLCELKSVPIRTIRGTDEPFAAMGFENKIPKTQLLRGKKYKSCVIVSSAGSLFGSKLGDFIDSHDLVMRFNHAPTQGYESDVGSKTTIRVVNSKVMSDKQFRFQSAAMFRGVSILAWDPSFYRATLKEWYHRPDFDMFSQYKRFMRRNPGADVHMLHPNTLWDLWDYLQNNTPFRILRNPPSSGFLGIAVLLYHCSTVDVVEYLPSSRVSRRCHYYGPETDTACTFGSWHPLSAEKVAAWRLSQASDLETFHWGRITIQGDERC